MSWSPTAVSGYNATPPADDGSQTAANTVSWATILSKIGNPLKTAYDANIISIQPFLVPTGVVMPFAGSSVPTGWLLCAGQAVSRATYADLFSVISTTYGVGDGATTFNVPDLRDRIVVGKADMGGSDAGRISLAATTTLGDTPGAETLPAHTHTGPSHTHDMANHTHTGGAHSHTITITDTRTWSYRTANNPSPGASATIAGAPATDVHNNNPSADVNGAAPTATAASGGNVATSGPSSNTTSASGTGNTGSTGTGSHGVLQPGLVLNYIIKV